MNADELKTAPTAELKVFEVLEVDFHIDVNSDAANQGQVTYYAEPLEDEESNEIFENRDKGLIQENQKAERCPLCGHRFTHAVGVYHRPSQQIFYIGRQCAQKIININGESAKISSATKRVAERMLCDRNEKTFRANASEQVQAALDYAQNDFAPQAMRDMISKVRRFGKLTEKQIDFMVNLQADDVARRAKGGEAPEGKQLVLGVVCSVKKPKNENHAFAPDFKMTVDLGKGVKVWGTAPKSITPESVGQKITFKADFTKSNKDPMFGFFKRPRVEKIPK